jgi:hypothetical protein
MRLPGVWWLLLGIAILAAPAHAQARACLHTGLESPGEVRRREEALAVARMIDSLMGRPRLPNQAARYPTWDELATSTIVSTLRGMGGPTGELARKIHWGSSEPLPGWRMRHLATDDGYAFSLTDTRDPCGLAYYSDETGTIVEGHPVDRSRSGGIVPIT